MLLHLKQKGLQFTGKVALVDRVLLGKTEFLYIRGSFFAVKTDPEICPGIIRIGFIVGADIWHQEKALSGIPEDFSGRLLEVPVGTGILTMPLYQTLPKAEITCLDYSPDMMAQAKEKADRLGLQNVSFRQGDVGALPFEDGSFDEAQALYTELGDYCDSAEKADGFVQRKVSMTTSYDESCSGPLTTTYTYSSDGVLLSETRLYSEYPSMDDQTYEYEYAPDGSYTLTRDQVSSVYDDHGNLLGQGGVFQYDYVYEYYDDGTMSSCTALAEGSEDTLWIEEYDRHGSTDRYIEADGTAYDFVNTYKGNLLYQQDKYDASGALVGNIKYEYDGDGRLTKKTVIENGNVSKAVVTEFVYGYVYAPDAKAAEEAKKAAEEEAKLAAEAAAQSEEADSTEDAAETAEPEVTAEAVQ